ncbi:hypothetical protein [Demequina aurantiaca]|uniref:hypothetical protein n=1 Tax=Demequina aurantiaca TaxID=676200 RepID=UPI003D33B963
MATWDEAGDLEISFPVCAGETVVYVVALAGDVSTESWVVRQGDPESPVTENQVFDFLITSELLSEGLLTDQLPVIDPFEAGYPTEIADFEGVYVLTTDFGAGVDVEDIDGPGSWIIDGDPIDHDAWPVRTTRAEGMAQIAAFCESERS